MSCRLLCGVFFIFASQISTAGQSAASVQMVPNVHECEDTVAGGSPRERLQALIDELNKPEELRQQKDRRWVKLGGPESNPVTIALRAKITQLEREIESEEQFLRNLDAVQQLAPSILGHELQKPAATVVARAIGRLEDTDANQILSRFKEIRNAQVAQVGVVEDPEVAVLAILSREYDKTPQEIWQIFYEMIQAHQRLGFGEVSNLKAVILTSARLALKLRLRRVTPRFIKVVLKRFDRMEVTESYSWSREVPHSMMAATDFVTIHGGLGPELNAFAHHAGNDFDGGGFGHTGTFGGF